MDVTTENITELLAQLPVKRLRAEAILDELLASGFCRPQDVVISPERSSAYFYERDVAEVEEIFDPLSSRSWFKVNIPRDGFYDTLPERLFHRPAGRLKNNDEWGEIRADEAQQETDARLFFLPFDSALNKQRVRIETFEKKALEGRDTSFLKEFLAIFWPDSNELALSEEQQFGLFHLTIIAHKVAGDIAWMQTCFRQMLGDEVRLFYEDLVYGIPVEAEFPSLGEALLGVDSILKTKSFLKWRRLKIQIGPLFYEQMRNYFPQKKGERLLHFLCNLLVPAEIDWDIDFIPKVRKEAEEEISGTPISFTVNNNNDRYAVLGYTTVL